MLMAGTPILLNRTVFLSKASLVRKTLSLTLIFTNSENNGAVIMVVGIMIIVKHPEDSLREIPPLFLLLFFWNLDNHMPVNFIPSIRSFLTSPL